MKEHILEEYNSSIHLNNAFANKMKALVEELLASESLRVHNVSCRLKEKQSLEKKLSKKGKYQSLHEITDIVGVRIITFFEDEVDIIAKLISMEFDVDLVNSVDKRVIEYDKFGYSSLHYVVSLKKERSILSEYASFKHKKFEIQIRSLLQHAWAEIEHDIGYKSKDIVPNVVKRNFSRVAALLETADFEFTKLRESLSTYEENVDAEIHVNPENVDLNSVSILSFYKSNTIISKIDEQIIAAVGSQLLDSEIDVTDIPKLKYLGVSSIGQLSRLLTSKKNKIVDFAVSFMNALGHSHDGGLTVRGISLFYLCYLLIAERENREEVIRFVSEFWGDRHPDLPENIINAYSNIKK